MKIFNNYINLDNWNTIWQNNSWFYNAKKDLIEALWSDWEKIISIAEKYSHNPDAAILRFLENWWSILDIKI